MKRPEPYTIILIVLTLVGIMFGVAALWYQLYGPCEIHRRLDTTQHLPARCQK